MQIGKRRILAENRRVSRRANKGMSMVEVLVGFVILVGLLGGLSGSIAFAKNMYLRSVDMRKAQQHVTENIYKKDVLSGQTERQDTLQLKVITPAKSVNQKETSAPACLKNGNSVNLKIAYYNIITDELGGMDPDVNDTFVTIRLFEKVE